MRAVAMPNGRLSVAPVAGRTSVIVKRAGEPEEVIRCLGQGHARQVRLRFSDAGMVGFAGDALCVHPARMPRARRASVNPPGQTGPRSGQIRQPTLGSGR